MKYIFNPITGHLNVNKPIPAVTTSDTAPTDPFDGMFWIDTVSGNLYCWYTDTWYIIRTMIALGGNQGIPIGFGGLLHLTY